MSNKIDKTLILNKIKDIYGYAKDVEFAKFLEIAPTTLSSWMKRGSFDIELLYSKCVDINPVFLITGEGPVKQNAENRKSDKEVMENRKSDSYDSEVSKIQEVNETQIFKLRTDRIIDDQSVPLYNLEATAGVVALFNDHNGTDPIDYIKIPNLPKCDGALHITGDSMYPLLKSGDIIMYKQVEDIENDIFWGEMYLVGIDLQGEEHVLVKYIQRSEKEGYIKLVSQNKHHQDKDIKLSKIKALALVKASIRINSMF